MNNEITNYIIPPWDPRYGKLGHIWKKYNWKSVVYVEGYYSTYFYIPTELVIKDYTRYCRVLKLIDKTDDWCNWIYKRECKRILEYSCSLTMQEYFDLVILHINNRSDRPKCPVDSNIIPFYSIYYGYGSPYTSWDNKELPICCSRSCRDIYRHKQDDD